VTIAIGVESRVSLQAMLRPCSNGMPSARPDDWRTFKTLLNDARNYVRTGQTNGSAVPR